MQNEERLRKRGTFIINVNTRQNVLEENVLPVGSLKASGGGNV